MAISFAFKRESRRAAPHKALEIPSDGDTPKIEQPIRMVSVDTPEKAYGGKAAAGQEKLNRCRRRLEEGFFGKYIPEAALIDYLAEKLTPTAAADHIAAAEAATAYFKDRMKQRLSKGGRRRRMAVIPTGEIIDPYGRLLAYTAPYFAGTEADPVPPKGHKDRETFNLDMIRSGHGAPFLIYPSIPHNDDLKVFMQAAVDAWEKRRGQWSKKREKVLPAYEYRLCIKLGEQIKGGETPGNARALVQKAFQRSCVDISGSKAKDLGPFGFHKVIPPYRLWYWLTDELDARRDLELA